jgi:DHA1 family bicyclomycin/chloramphenicol resistance-like MFS transporter
MNDHKTIAIKPLGRLLLTVNAVTRTGACLYLPAIPLIGHDLGISDAGMGITVTAYFAVFALCSLIVGPFSDAFGRQKIIISGLAVFIAGSLVCTMADGFTLLITGRILQAVGASMIPGTSRAMVRDAATDTQFVSLLGWLAVLGGILLVGAPVLGGFITQYAGWRANFLALLLFATAVFVMLLFKLPETLTIARRTAFVPGQALRSYLTMVKSGDFTLVMLPVICCFIFQGAYLALASFVFVKELGFTPVQFGLSNIIIVVGLAGGRKISLRTENSASAAIGYRYSALVLLLTSSVAATLIITGVVTAIPVMLTVFLFALGFGIVSPLGMKASISAFRQQSGTAAALQGFGLLGATAVGSAGAAVAMKYLPELPPARLFAYCALIIPLLAAVAAELGAKHLSGNSSKS